MVGAIFTTFTNMNILSIIALLAVLATNPDIEYSGRIDFGEPEAPCFSYSGVSIRACIDATEANAIIDDEIGGNRFALIVDNVYTGKITTQRGRGSYQVFRSQAKETHEIELVRITEADFGKTKFAGFELSNDGKIMPIGHQRKHVIEFVGNSITCGYGNEGRIGQRFGAETENHYLTYAAIAARSFDAATIVASKSGIGVYRNYAGPSTGNEDCMPNRYDRIHLYDSLPKYSFSIQPDLICINLGTNDFSTPGYQANLFVSNYLRLIADIQSRYKNPDIVCLLGTMLTDKALDTARHCIKMVVDSANSWNKGRVSFFEMTPQNIRANGLGIDYHPTVRQHIASARELVEFIGQLKGWQVTEQIVFAQVTGNNQLTLFANSAACLHSKAMSSLAVTADNRTIKPANLQIDDSNATLTLTFDEDLHQFEHIILSGNAELNNFLRRREVVF